MNKPLYPRLPNACRVQTKNGFYKAHWLNLSKNYEFTSELSGKVGLKTEAEVAQLLKEKRMIIVSHDLDIAWETKIDMKK